MAKQSEKHSPQLKPTKNPSCHARFARCSLRLQGKYPIHFHMVGALPLSFVKNCTIHHSFNRALSIHGTNNVTIANNLVFDTRGHAIFIEDGTEEFNIIKDNAVGLVRPAWSLLQVDQTPAAYWIVNPNNVVENNIAFGR